MMLFTQIHLRNLAFLENIKALNITPVELDISLLKSRSIKLTHHDYPLTEPIIVQKHSIDDQFYIVRDGYHRVQQAKDLGKTMILSIIVPCTNRIESY